MFRGGRRGGVPVTFGRDKKRRPLSGGTTSPVASEGGTRRVGFEQRLKTSFVLGWSVVHLLLSSNGK